MKPQRNRLPDDRTEVGRKFRVGEYEGYIHVGIYDDGSPGDIFVDIAKEGTTLAGLMNAFMISVSLGLQYGVPLEVYVSKFAHMRFEPSGAHERPGHPRREVDRRLRLPLDGQEVPHGRPAGGDRHPLARGARPHGRGVRERRPGACRSSGAPDPGPDRALQHARGRDRVLTLRRADGPGGDVLHVPRLRDVHRLRLSGERIQATSGPSTRPRFSSSAAEAERELPGALEVEQEALALEPAGIAAGARRSCRRRDGKGRRWTAGCAPRPDRRRGRRSSSRRALRPAPRTSPSRRTESPAAATTPAPRRCRRALRSAARSPCCRRRRYARSWLAASAMTGSAGSSTTSPHAVGPGSSSGPGSRRRPERRRSRPP